MEDTVGIINVEHGYDSMEDQSGLSAEQKDVIEVSKEKDVELPTVMHTYQGSTSSSHAIFVRGNSIEPDKTLVILEDAKKQNKEIATVSRVHIHYCEGRASPHQYYPRWVRGLMFDMLGDSSNMIGMEFVNFKRTYSDVFWSKPVQREMLLEHGMKELVSCHGDCLWGKR
ncbi:hypothetical protein DY000_02028731 [Brassica cretica]|uniref:Uncharacterized protein n=1 Tax=Brassica cretica TaxID=69181 RepID=A0ABQ7DI48_BRACR|nr:hypothetical protein DY000_02028731 [Brassica cretica]